MKLKNKKIVVSFFLMLSIVNIIFSIKNILVSIAGNHSFNQSVSLSSNITIFAIPVLLLQIINIILTLIVLRKNLESKREKYILLLAFVIIIVTLFIPVKEISNIKYTYPTNSKNEGSLKPSDLGSTTHINIYKNLYGITLKKDEKTSLGISIYN